MNEKKLWLSKTFWLGIITAVAPALSADVQALIQEHTVTFGILWGAASVILRLVTKDKVKLLD